MNQPNTPPKGSEPVQGKQLSKEGDGIHPIGMQKVASTSESNKSQDNMQQHATPFKGDAQEYESG